MSLESSQKVLAILESLQDQGLLGKLYCFYVQTALTKDLETFLPWDLDALFVSTMVLIITRFVDQSLLDDRTPWLEKAFVLMEIMISSGNRIADYRMRELRRLDEMLTEYATVQERHMSIDPLIQQPSQISTNTQPTIAHISEDRTSTKSIFASPEGGPLYSGFSDEGSGFGDDLTAEQILAVAESMDIEGTDWLCSNLFDNYQPLDMVDPHLH